MKLFPAIDLRRGRVVTLVGGVDGTQTTDQPDPRAVYERWVNEGAEWLHVVDLDAAFGKGDHRLVIEDLLSDGRARLQVGGGIRTTEQAERLFSRGAERVVVGTRAVEDPPWLGDLTTAHPGQVVLAVDARDGRVVTRGWARETPHDVVEFVQRMNALPLAAFLFTAVHVEGQMKGMDYDAVVQVVNAAKRPVVASGGITTYDDLKFLKGLGVDGAVLGAALYQGRIEFPVAKNLMEGV